MKANELRIGNFINGKKRITRKKKKRIREIVRKFKMKTNKFFAERGNIKSFYPDKKIDVLL